MLGIERIADLFDELHTENKRSLGIEFQSWVNNVYRSEGESWRFYGAAATAAAADALYTFAGGAGAGLVDLLRLGDGVKAGSLGGLVQDTFRLITVTAGGFKVFRVAMASVEIGGANTCVISSTAKAGVLSGRWFDLSSLFDRLATVVGGRSVVSAASFPGLPSTLAFLDYLRMFTKATVMRVSSIDEVMNAARISSGPVVFGVYWRGGGGHAMVAFRDFLGRIRFADQYGRLITSVEELGHVSSVHGDLLIVHDALVVQTARAGSVFHLLVAQIKLLHPEGMAKLDQQVRARRTDR